MSRAFAFFILLLVTGCGSFESKFRPTPYDAIQGAWDQKVQEGPEYTGFAVHSLESVGAPLTRFEPADIDSFCPGYRTRDRVGRVGFWVGLISAMSKWESDFQSGQDYTESFKSKGKPVVSRGLLQMSFDSANSYGCAFDSADELHEARRNIDCAVRALSNLVLRDGVISGETAQGEALGGARYWAVLRRGHKALEEIRRVTRALPVCL